MSDQELNEIRDRLMENALRWSDVAGGGAIDGEAGTFGIELSNGNEVFVTITPA